MPFVVNPIDTVRVYYEVEGHGPALMLHHGLLSSIDDWREHGFVAALRDAYRLLLVEPRGHGRSERPHEPDLYPLSRMATDVVAVLDDAGVERAHFFGYSMGATVGYHALGAAPDRFMSLVGGGGPVHPPVTLFDRLAPVLAHGPHALLAALDRPPGSLPPGQRERILDTDTEALLALIEAHRQPWSPETMLPLIDTPSLIFAGHDDPVYNDVARAARLLPNARFLSLPGLDHQTAIARSDASLPHVLAFLSDVQTS